MTARARGFTLIEISISVALLALLMAGVSAILIKQSQASAVQIAQRDLEESGRLALLEIARAIREAGFGITPIAAFDFDRFACTTPGTSTTCPNGGRDRADGPDEIVVAWRDPSFSRTVTARTGTGPWTFNLATALAAQLNAGRIVQLLCSGAEPSSYLAVNTDTPAGAATITVRALTDADGYFPQATPADSCFASAQMFLLERVRFYVANDTDGVPSLYRDRGRSTQELLYRGIEDLQISYAIGQPPAGSAFAPGGATPAAAPGCNDTSVTDGGAVATWSFGSCVGTAGTPLESATAPDWRNDAYDSANRYTGHPANIRSVTLFVVARATRQSPDGTGDPVPALGNRPARNPDRFHRAVLSVSEPTQNLLTRANFLPPVFTNGNVGGG